MAQARIQWTPEMDATLRAMKVAKATWQAVADALRVGRCTVIDRARVLDRDMGRLPSVKPSETRSPPADSDLAASVVYQALLDATECAGIVGANREIALVRDEARSFCLTSSGPWAQAREAWCDLAGVHPDRFRERAAQLISGKASLDGLLLNGRAWTPEARAAHGRRAEA